MKTIEDMIAGYQRFRAGRFQREAALYEQLGSGQSPDVLIIGCADSRVDPAQIFDAAPAELFVVRNVANLVPPFQPSNGLHGVGAAVEFAVTALKIKHIVVMGHSGCGGVAASLAAADDRPVGEFIAPWMTLLDETRDAVLASDPPDRQRALEHAGILTSIENLRTFPFVQDALGAGTLSLHGAWFAIGRGELHWFSEDAGRFEKIAS